MKDTILVTGGKGFLGDHIVRRFSEIGCNVNIFTRPNKVNNPQNDPESNITWGDIRNADDVQKAVKGVDRVIHLVSNFRKGGSDKNEAYSINVEGTRNVLNAAQKYKVKQLIHCSTIGVHGDVREIPANERSTFNPGDLYQETKLIAEKHVWQFYKDTKLPTTIIRPISMYGPGDLRMLKLFRMIKKGRFVVVGDGKALFQPAYIDDVVQGFERCLGNHNAVGQAFIIGNEEYVPLNTLFRTIAQVLGVTPPKLKVPMMPVVILAAMCEKVCGPFGIEPPLHRRRVSFFRNNRAFSIKKAKKVLGFNPQVNLIEGIRKTIKWYTENDLL